MLVLIQVFRGVSGRKWMPRKCDSRKFLFSVSQVISTVLYYESCNILKTTFAIALWDLVLKSSWSLGSGTVVNYDPQLCGTASLANDTTSKVTK